MSNAGQAALTIAGTAVGAFFGYPQLGYVIGSMAGQAFFPTDLGTVEGPRLNDLTIQTSTVGAPIPIVYGTHAISGNLIWSAGIEETVTKKKQGGKGGPTQTIKTYTYSVSCAIGICEGTIGDLLRVWADAKLVYDARPQQPGELATEYSDRLAANLEFLDRIELYTGTETQEPDPTIEFLEGVGNVSAFRGLAYIVFTDFQLADYGNRVPQFRFEVVNVPVPQPQWDLSLGHWTGKEFDTSTWVYKGYDNSPGTWQGGPTSFTAYFTEGPFGLYPMMHLVVASTDGLDYPGPPVSKITRFEVINMERMMDDNWDITTFEQAGGRQFNYDGTPDNHPYSGTWGYPASPWSMTVTEFGLRLMAGVDGMTSSPRYGLFNVPVPYDIGTAVFTEIAWMFASGVPVGGGGLQGFPAISPDGMHIFIAGDYADSIARNKVYRFDMDVPWGPPSIPHPSMSNTFWANEAIVVDPIFHGGGDFASGIQFQDDGYQMYVGAGWFTLTEPYDPTTASWASTDPGGIGNIFSQSLEGVPPFTNHDVATQQPIWHPRGHKFYLYDNSSGGTAKLYEFLLVDPIVPECITLGQIVRDLCLRCGLSEDQIDVSDLTECVDGYVVARPMPTRNAIEPLRSYGFFDCVESGGVLKWPTRGKAAVATLSVDDLCAHESGGSRPSAIQVVRQQSVELPRRLSVHYAQVAMNYEPGEQSASRLAEGALETQSVEVSVAMSDRKAAQIADVLLYERWVARNKYRFVLSKEYLALEPADAIIVPVDGDAQRLRIVATDHSLIGLLQVEAVRDDDGSYVSYAIGAPPAYSGTGGGTISILGSPVLELLDLPLLRDEDNNAGYYAAIEAEGSTVFGGAVLLRSPDGGANYSSVAATDNQAEIGTLVSALPSGPSTIIDEGSELVVANLSSSALESITEVSLLAGLNAAAIGADGRWEVIQFRDAVLAGDPPVWTLTGLLRGRRGTEWAIGMSQIGDSFVLLDSSLMRVSLNVAQLNVEREHKAVLSGKSIASAPVELFTARGVALKPFAPVHAEGTWDGDDLEITWIRRGRIGQELPGGGDIPLSEETEAYEVEILDDAVSPPDVLRTISTGTPNVTYTGAQRVEDFGSPVPASVSIRIYQLSASVGRGYPLEAVV